MRRNLHGSNNVTFDDDDDDGCNGEGDLSFTAPTFAMNNDLTPQWRNRGRAAANDDGDDGNRRHHRHQHHHNHEEHQQQQQGNNSSVGQRRRYSAQQQHHHHIRNGVHAVTTLRRSHDDSDSKNDSMCSNDGDIDRRGQRNGRRSGGSSVHGGDDDDDDDDDDNDEDMPSVLAISRSNIPGKTPQELLAEHRKSIAEFSRRPEGTIDLHSITLSRNQIEPDVPYVQCAGSMSSTELQGALGGFSFGERAQPQQTHMPLRVDDSDDMVLQD